MLGVMDARGISETHVVGNSMGGRVAIEMGLVAPERIGAVALLCPAVAWVRRGLHPIVRTHDLLLGFFAEAERARRRDGLHPRGAQAA
jgi:pimeloyl-ACP methyl ester carboxylesterase